MTFAFKRDFGKEVQKYNVKCLHKYSNMYILYIYIYSYIIPASKLLLHYDEIIYLRIKNTKTNLFVCVR